jgi:putative DNA methylase
MIEIPPKFAGRAPVGPLPKGEHGGSLGLQHDWPGATGLAEDVRRYGAWMRNEACKRIGHLYLPVEVTAEMAKDRLDLKPLVGQKLTVIAWLWARTVKSPNPAFRHVDAPLVSTFILSSKEGKQVYVQPVVEGDRYRFTVKAGRPPAEAISGTKLTMANFRCVLSGAPIGGDYIKQEAQAGRMGAKLMAIVAEGSRGRVYLPPNMEQENIAHRAEPSWRPDVEFFPQALGFRVGNYGMAKWSDLFTPRQLAVLTTFSDLVTEARDRIRQDALAAGMVDDVRGFDSGGTGAAPYSEAVSVYLGLGVDKASDYNCSLVTWIHQRDQAGHALTKQALPMVWDFVEVNPFVGAAGDLTVSLQGIARVTEALPTDLPGIAGQWNATSDCTAQPIGAVVSTDPPYYDNIGYADLSDFFYVWLRRSLRSVFPSLFSTMTVPKAEELVATPYRHGNRARAEAFFLDGMTRAMRAG